MKTIQCKEFLKLLSESKTPKRRKLLIDWASKKDIDALSEIALNTLKGNLKLSPNVFKKIQKHKRTIRLIACKKQKISKKKRIIKQSGGFLPLLIPAAISVVSSIVSAIKNKRKKLKN